jgi:NADH-quinone oxidoreductase subunit F
MPTLVSHPDEVKVVSRRFGMGATDIDKYVELDGYKAVQMGIENGPQWIIDTMKASGLRGRGGAGFPTGMKWSFVPKESAKPKYVLVNGDESEPGTCKDHVLFLHDPHSVIEGTMIAGLAIGSKVGFIYLRGEYRYLLNIVEKAVADAYAKGFLGKNIFGKEGVDFDIITQTGAGAYEVAKSPRSWSRSKASAAFPASNRHFRQSSASTAARPSSTTPRPSPTLRTSC